MHTTPFLYYGPGAFEAASRMAASLGRPLPPVGGGGLKVSDSRELVELAMEGVVDDRQPSVVVGPMDDSTPEASDALLKTLEEGEGTQLLRFVLWSHNLHGVVPTIQSRCNCVWSPAVSLSEDPPINSSAEEFLDFFLSNKSAEAIGILVKCEDWGQLLSAVSDSVAIRMRGSSHKDLETLQDLWLKMRPLMDTKHSGRAGVILPISALFCGN